MRTPPASTERNSPAVAAAAGEQNNRGACLGGGRGGARVGSRNSDLSSDGAHQLSRKTVKGPIGKQRADSSSSGGKQAVTVPVNSASKSGRSTPAPSAHGVASRDRLSNAKPQTPLAAIDSAPVAAISSLTGDEHRKQSHCEIEKRRRDKMNHYIMKLASSIPSFSNNQSKFDKLTVLRMAVQHVKSLRSSLCSFSSFHLRPSFLSSGNLLKNLILQMAGQEAQDNLFMVVTCDRGKVLFVSQSSKDILNQDQHELVGQCLFDFLHKDDVSKVKEQISYFNLMPKEMLVDSRTLQPIKHNQRQTFNQMQNQSNNSTPQPGARRSFFCRMKSGRSSNGGGNIDNGGSNNGASQQSSGKSSASSAPSSTLSQMPAPPLATRHSNTDSSRINNSSGTNSDINRRDETQNSSVISDYRQGSNDSLTNSNIPLNAQKNSQTSNIDHLNSNMSSCLPGSDLISSFCGPNTFVNENREKEFNYKNTSSTNNSNSDCRNVANENSVSTNGRTNNTRINNNGNKDNSDFSSSSTKDESTKKENVDQERDRANSERHNGCNNSISSSSNETGSRIDNATSEGSESSGRSGPGEGNTSDRPTSCNDSSLSVNKSSCNSKRSSNGTKQSSNGVNSGLSSKKHWRYIVMHCTGYLKAITLKSDEFEDEDFDDYNSDNNSSDEEDGDSCRTINCLVAVCRRSPMDRDLKPDRPLTFTCRYSMEGKFVFVDQRTTVALGYTPQQLLGTSHYAYCHKDSVNTFKECHRQSILKSEPVSSDIYQFKRANGQHLWLQTSLKSFRNPWTKFIDYIVASHTTAEGNDPHYNEGCVPTKFNQDMTGEASQSSSPASSSSLSLPSMDSKKSSSPSSSSIGSSYSMDSYASGGSIQALLNQIDRVKSGGSKYRLDLHKRRGDNYPIRSGGGSAKKSNEDSGNYSDPQSCSSFSSQNSSLSAEYVNVPTINNYVYNNPNQTSVTNHLPNQNVSSNYYNQKIDNFRAASNLYGPTSYQQQACRQPVESSSSIASSLPTFETNSTTSDPMRDAKAGPRMAGKVGRHQNNSMKPHQRQYGNHQYPYRNHSKSHSTSSDTGNESGTWSNSGSSVFSDNSSHHSVQAPLRSTVAPNIIKDSGNGPVCGLQIQDSSCQRMNEMHDRQPTYALQPVEAPPMNIVPEQMPTTSQMSTMNDGVDENYPNEMIPVRSYISQDANVSYDPSVDLNQVQQMTDHLQPTMTIQMPQLQNQMQRSTQEQASSIDHMNMPMIWTTTEAPYQNLETLHNTNSGQICSNGDMTLMNMDIGNQANQIISQPTVHCQQCANHKCSNQQMLMASTDLNSINLTSLAVEGDLDEDQLLEYLAGCDPESQLYHIQNNAFPQYNMYR